MLNIEWGMEDCINEQHTAKNDLDSLEAKLSGNKLQRAKCP